MTGARSAGAALLRSSEMWPDLVATAFLVASTVTWRQGSYYSGGADPTVAAKAVLGVLAAFLATRSGRRTTRRHRLNGRPVLYLAVYLTVSLLGAAATGYTLVASLVLVVRLLLIAYTVYQLSVTRPPVRLLLLLAGWMAAFAVVASVTGTTGGSRRVGAGRLIGGIPALQPNEIAQLCGLVAIILIWRDLESRGRTWDVLAIAGLAALIWLTGSRTTLGFLALAVILLLVQARRFSIGVVLAILVLIPIGCYLAFATSSVSGYFGRGGSTNLGTLNQRTVAWSAALHVHTGFWETWFGNGLSRVTVPVVAQYRTDQLLDSSWLSALVQSGIVGVVVLVVWLVGVGRGILRTERAPRSLMLSLMAFVLLLATFETGLFTASPLFIVLVLVSVGAGPVPEKARSGTKDPLDGSTTRLTSAVDTRVG